jgi:hypothetical protein
VPEVPEVPLGATFHLVSFYLFLLYMSSNPWILFLKKYANDTNQSYACALSDPEASALYRQTQNKDPHEAYMAYLDKSKKATHKRHEIAQKKMDKMTDLEAGRFYEKFEKLEEKHTARDKKKLEEFRSTQTAKSSNLKLPKKRAVAYSR